VYGSGWTWLIDNDSNLEVCNGFNSGIDILFFDFFSSSPAFFFSPIFDFFSSTPASSSPLLLFSLLLLSSPSPAFFFSPIFFDFFSSFLSSY
jgi:hypothetical protein